MKLAQALIERKAIKTKMEEIKKRIYQNARIQEGDISIEEPLKLLDELDSEVQEYSAIICRINETNNATKIDKNLSMMEAIIQKDMLHLKYLVYQNLADKAVAKGDRYSRREIKYLPNIDIETIRKKINKVSKEYRELDMKIQECNWNTELI